MDAAPISTPHLPALGFVAELSDDDRAMLSSYGHFRRYDAGSKVIEEGAVQESLYFLISGLLHASRRDGDRPVLLGQIRAGEWFGEINIFDPATATATVVAVEDAQVWHTTRGDLEQFIQNYPTAGMQLVISIAAVLSQRVRMLTQRMLDEAEMAVVRASLLIG
jgi:CRP-like cAMP-binding protein